MTKPRKDPSKKSGNETKHRKARADPKVLELLSNLEQGWATMDFVEQGKELRKLIALGCSVRGLAGDLGQPETNIRRLIPPAEQPKADRGVQETGASEMAARERRVNAERDERQRLRVIEEKKTGAHSDKLATVILEFCRVKCELRETPILKEEIPLLLSTAEEYLSQFETSGRQTVALLPDMDLKDLFMATRPEEEGELRMNHYGKWMAIVVWAMAPERPIWERALWKALNRACELAPQLNRAGELAPQLDQAGELAPQRSRVDRYTDSEIRLRAIADSPGRPHPDVPVSVLRRQGRG